MVEKARTTRTTKKATRKKNGTLRLVPQREYYSKEVTSMLERAIAIAKDENCTGVAIAFIDSAGYVNGLWTSENTGLLLGSLEQLKYRILRKFNED